MCVGRVCEGCVLWEGVSVLLERCVWCVCVWGGVCVCGDEVGVLREGCVCVCVLVRVR